MANEARPGWKMIRVRPETHSRLSQAAGQHESTGAPESLNDVIARALDALERQSRPGVAS